MRFTLLLSALTAVLLIGVGRPATASPISSGPGQHGTRGITMRADHDGGPPVSFCDDFPPGWPREDSDHDAREFGWSRGSDHPDGWRPHDDFGPGGPAHGHDCAPVPEPGTLALVAIGLSGLVARRR